MRLLLTLVLVLGGVAAVYATGLDNGFVWLDHYEIEEGALTADTPGEALALLRDDRNFAGYHRPLYSLAHSLDRALFGLAPRGFQVTTRLWHLLDVALVLLVARRLGWSLPAAGLLALLFGLHPLNTACAGLIHAKADLIVFAALAGSVALAVRRYPAPARRSDVALSLSCYGLALLAKETAFVLPLGASLAWLAERGGRGACRVSGAWVDRAWALAALVALWRLLGAAPPYASTLGLPERLATFALVYLDDLRRLVLPLDPTIADTVTRFGALDGVARARGLAALALVLFAEVWLWRRRPWARKWLVLGHLALLPVAQVVPILHFRADRFLHVPTLAFLGGVVEAAARAALAARARPRTGLALAASGLALAGLYAWRDVPRLRVFASDGTLFATELARRPDYLEGLSQLARHLDRIGRPALATPLYAACFAPHPGIVSYFDGERTLLASSANLLAVGRPADALALLERWSGPVVSPVVREELAYNRAVALFRLGRAAEALPLLDAYAAGHPHDAHCAWLQGEAARRAGARARALDAFARYLSLAPDAPERAELEAYASAPAD